MDKRISVLLVLNDNLLRSNHNLSNDVRDTGTALDNIGLTVVADATDISGIIWTILQEQFIP